MQYWEKIWHIRYRVIWDTIGRLGKAIIALKTQRFRVINDNPYFMQGVKLAPRVHVNVLV